MKLLKIILAFCYFSFVSLFIILFVNSSSITKVEYKNDITYYITEPVFYQPKDKINMWINIPTYDGSNEVTHPKVLYFENGFNNYKYWMVNTPYPNNNAYLENPSIVVSNDGINWIEPDGISNPVSGYPTKVRDDSYYSDPFMLYDEDHFELYFRKTKSVLNGKVFRNGYNYLYKETSNDGINWTEPKMILDNNPPERYMSPSVIKENGIYKIWYVNYEGNVRYTESSDLITYTNPINVNIKDFNKNVWHGEIQYHDNKYIYIFMIKYKLFYTESKDGKNFDKPILINTKIEDLKVNNHIYKTTYVIKDEYIELFTPYRVNYKWKMHYSKILISELLKNV